MVGKDFVSKSAWQGGAEFIWSGPPRQGQGVARNGAAVRSPKRRRGPEGPLLISDFRHRGLGPRCDENYAAAFSAEAAAAVDLVRFSTAAAAALFSWASACTTAALTFSVASA